MKDIQLAIQSIFRTPKAIFTYKLIPFFLLAGLISLGIGVLLFYGSWSWGDDIGLKISSWYPWEKGANLIDSIGVWVGRIIVLIVSLLIYKYIILIVVSPLMSPLSQRIESALNPNLKTESFQFSKFLQDLSRGIRISFRNLSYELFITAGLLILSLIPGIVIITTPLIFIVQAYYAGFGNMDYYMERHLNTREAVLFVRKHRLFAVANGSIFILVLAIPFIGFLIAPGICATMASLGVNKMKLKD